MFGSDGHGHSHGPGGHSHDGGGHSHDGAGMSNVFGNLFSSGDGSSRMPSPPLMNAGDIQRPSLTPAQIMQMRMQMMQQMQQMLAAGGTPAPQFAIPMAGPDGMPRMPGPSGPIGGAPSSGGLFGSSSSPPLPTDSFQFSPWPNQDAPPATTDSSVPTTSQLLTTTAASDTGDSKAPATLPPSNLPERMLELVRATQFGLFDKYSTLILFLTPYLQ